MPEDFTINSTESVRTYAQDKHRWVHFYRHKTDINGRKSTTLFAELHKDRAAAFIEWLQDLYQE